MQKVFLVYKRFLGAVFILWLFLWTAGKFGFGFEIDLKIFFMVFFCPFFIYLVWEIKIRWWVIYPIIKTFFLKARADFTLKTETTKKEIISFSPKIFVGKTGSSLALILAITLPLFSLFWQFFEALSRFILKPGTLLVFAILGILTDIFIFDFASDVIILILAGLWVWVIWHYKFKGEVSVNGALVFLIMCLFLLISKKDPIAGKAAIWMYMFLAIGVIQMVIEYVKEEKRCVQKEE